MVGCIVQIADETDPLRSDTTLLVAALLTLGIPPADNSLFHCTYELVRGATVFRAMWTLRDESRDKRFETLKMQAGWASHDWLLQNPKHPLATLRSGLTFARALSHTPRFTAAELARIETPDTWLEAACRNLIFLLRQMPTAVPEGIVRFGPRHAAMVPRNLPEKKKTRFLRYVETPSKRPEILRAA